MAKRWMGVALLAGWLGMSAAARAQFPPGYGPGAGPPGAPGAEYGAPPPPSPDGPLPPAESLPPNSFSNVHPDQVKMSQRFYLGAEYLLWWVRHRQVPTLVSDGVLTDPFPAALGQPNTKPFIGPGSLDDPMQSGVRVTGTWWFDQDHCVGVEGSAFWLQNQAPGRAVSGDGSSNVVLARPFFNPNTGLQDADPLVVPGIQSGALQISLPRRFMGADANLRYSLDADVLGLCRINWLAGVRYLYLDEKLLISETVTDLPDSQGNPGNSFTLHDSFATYNRFYGGQVGLEGEWRVGPMMLTLAGKVAVGPTTQTIKINGDSTVIEPGGVVTVDNTRGLLVQPSNSGRFTHTNLSVVPEVSLNLAWEFNEYVRASVGYNFLYWTRVARPGDQVDTTVNVGAVGDPGQLGTSPHPLLMSHTTGFWAQGLTAGVVISY